MIETDTLINKYITFIQHTDVESFKQSYASDDGFSENGYIEYMCLQYCVQHDYQPFISVLHQCCIDANRYDIVRTTLQAAAYNKAITLECVTMNCVECFELIVDCFELSICRDVISRVMLLGRHSFLSVLLDKYHVHMDEGCLLDVCNKSLSVITRDDKIQCLFYLFIYHPQLCINLEFIRTVIQQFAKTPIVLQMLFNHIMKPLIQSLLNSTTTDRAMLSLVKSFLWVYVRTISLHEYYHLLVQMVESIDEYDLVLDYIHILITDDWTTGCHYMYLFLLTKCTSVTATLKLFSFCWGYTKSFEVRECLLLCTPQVFRVTNPKLDDTYNGNWLHDEIYSRKHSGLEYLEMHVSCNHIRNSWLYAQYKYLLLSVMPALDDMMNANKYPKLVRTHKEFVNMLDLVDFICSHFVPQCLCDMIVKLC